MRAGVLVVVCAGASNVAAQSGPIVYVPPEVSDGFASFEFLIAAGVDVPTLRLFRVSRRQYLTGYVHRGPANGSGRILTIGMSATWRSH